MFCWAGSVQVKTGARLCVVVLSRTPQSFACAELAGRRSVATASQLVAARDAQARSSRVGGVVELDSYLSGDAGVGAAVGRVAAASGGCTTAAARLSLETQDPVTRQLGCRLYVANSKQVVQVTQCWCMPTAVQGTVACRGSLIS